MDRELTEVRVERPRIDGFLTNQLDAIQRLETDLGRVRTQIREIVGQEERLASARLVDHERSRLVGRISLYVESITEVPIEDSLKIDVLREQIAELEELGDADVKRSQLADESQRMETLRQSCWQNFRLKRHTATVPSSSALSTTSTAGS